MKNLANKEKEENNEKGISRYDASGPTLMLTGAVSK